MNDVVLKMIDFASELKSEDIPSSARHQAKRLLLDSLGCAVGGYSVPDCQIVLKVIRKINSKGSSTIIGRGEKASPHLAALANGLMVRALDFNDIFWRNDPSHPSDMVPSALAVGEDLCSSGKDVLTAIVLGYELEMRLCKMFLPSLMAQGWHHSTITSVVAPLVAGKLMDLDRKQMQNACGISGAHSILGVVTSGKLSMMKNIADPWAASRGVFSAMLAREGFTGTPDPIQGKNGLCTATRTTCDENSLGTFSEDRFWIDLCSIKSYPSEYLTHAPITAALLLVQEHNLTPQEIDKVVVHTYEEAYDILADPAKFHPTSKETADHSMPYCVAAAIVARKLDRQQFDEAYLGDDRIKTIINQMTVVKDKTLSGIFPESQPVIIEIYTRSGRVYSKRVDYPKGDPRNPVTDQELVSKFNGLAREHFSELRLVQIAGTVFEIDKLRDLSQLMDLLVF